MNPLCVFHAPCADGFTAAWAVWKKHPDWSFYGAAYGAKPPYVADRDVVLVDYSYPRAVIEQLLGEARSITILDHHKSAAEELEPLLADGAICGTIDQRHSGARLAWDWFHPGKPPPALLPHVEDYDLWRFDLPETRELMAALYAREYTFETWDGLMLDYPLDALARDGAAILRVQDKHIREFIEHAQRRMIIAGFNVPALNAPYFYSSDAGHLMAAGEPFACCYWDVPDARVFSLRSAEHGEDVASIAARYGGGGHTRASGFRVRFTDLAKEGLW